MTGGLLQLVAKGNHYDYLVENSTISNFNIVYKKRINFACEVIELLIKGKPDFGSKFEIELTNVGDLVSHCGLKIDLPEVYFTTEGGWVNDLGNMLIKDVTFEIGGRIIDKHYGLWMSIWNDLTLSHEQKITNNNLIGNVSTLTGTKLGLLKNSPIQARSIYIPFQFWFNKNPSLALPVCALKGESTNTGAKFIIQLETVRNLLRGDIININSIHLLNIKFFAEYIFLSKEERIWFTKKDFEITIPQLQYMSCNSNKKVNNIPLKSFNHPTLELIWCVRDKLSETSTGLSKNLVKFTDSNDKNPIVSGTIRINGVDRQMGLSGHYYNKIVPLHTHTGAHGNSGINVMSFCTKPEEFMEYTGSLNFSGLENIMLNLLLTDASASVNNDIFVFSRNLNILKFSCGMARVKYTN